MKYSTKTLNALVLYAAAACGTAEEVGPNHTSQTGSSTGSSSVLVPSSTGSYSNNASNGGFGGDYSAGGFGGNNSGGFGDAGKGGDSLGGDGGSYQVGGFGGMAGAGGTYMSSSSGMGGKGGDCQNKDKNCDDRESDDDGGNCRDNDD